MLPASRRQVLLVAVAASCPPVRAQVAPQPVRESLVKAAFLHKFASFVEWPAGSFPRNDSPLRIGVLGDDAVWRDLDELARDRDRDGRPVTVTRLAPGEALAGFHILYLHASAVRINDLLAQVPEGVLTVSDSEGAHPRGSVLSFFFEDGRVRFGASQEAAARQKLRLSARLLSVARVVQGAPAQPPA
jgi:hypothetical protein